jgi:1-aminocyclopropane-1-carboxylate deaminase/D-cysteine desulfhydrase-like pyridoxal-dependent ACC family enzyme
MRIKNDNELTPVELIDGIYYKRDDIYCPYDDLKLLSGSKVRQMKMLYDELKLSNQPPIGLITYSSVISPQSIIVAKVCHDNNIPCIICVGVNDNSNGEFINKHITLSLSQKYKAEIRNVAGIGFNTVLKQRAEKIASENGFTLVHFGINLENNKETLVNAIANQVMNLPDELDNLIIPCGSGVTTAGIIIGLKLFNKKVKRIIPVQISGYDRKNEIDNVLSLYGIKADYEFYIDITYNYTDQVVQFIKPGLQLNVIYEAKAFKYFLRNQKRLNIEKNQKTLFYIIADNNFLFPNMNF